MKTLKFFFVFYLLTKINFLKNSNNKKKYFIIIKFLIIIIILMGSIFSS